MPVKRKLPYIISVIILWALSYCLIQFFITGSDNSFLLPVDQQIPFIPEFIWIYHSLAPVLIITMIWMVKTRQNFFNMFWACIAASIIMNVFYIMMPCFHPRIALEASTLSEILVQATRYIDDAHNTLPSGHVTFAWLTLLAFINCSNFTSSRFLRFFYISWTVLISVSTLALKQHYVVDVASGITLAFLSFYSVRYLLNR
jgi:membrane-associated phospholipid phosphatase